MDKKAMIAGTLCLGHIPDAELAAALLARAHVSRALVMPTEPAGPSLKQSLRAPAAKATMIADSVTDPAVLDNLSKHPSITVRRAVASNRNMSAKTADYLIETAVKKVDAELFSNLAANPATSLRDVVGGLIRAPEADSALPDANGRHTERFTADPEAVLDLIRAGRRSGIRLLVDIAEGTVTSVSFADAVDASPNRDEARRHIAQHAQQFTHELLDVCNIVRSDGSLPHPTDATRTDFRTLLMRYNVPPDDHDEFQKVYPDDVVTRLLSAHPDLAPNFAHYPSRATVMQIIEATDGQGLTHLLDNHIDMLDEVALNTAVRRLADTVFSDGIVGKGTLVLNREDLSPALVLPYVRRAGWDVTRAWLSGECFHKPTADDVVELFADPRCAFGPIHVRHGGNVSGDEYTSGTLPMAGLAHTGPALAQIVTYAKDTQPWFDAIVDSLGEVAIAAFANPWVREGGGKYLADRFNREFGAHPDAWHTACDMLASSTQSVGRVCSMVRRTLGVTRPDPDHDDSDAGDPSTNSAADSEQLTLL